MAEVAPVVQSAPAQPVTVVDPGAVEAMTSSAVTPTAEALLVETEKTDKKAVVDQQGFDLHTKGASIEMKEWKITDPEASIKFTKEGS